MSKERGPLKLQVAAPCREDWNEMMGDEAVRFCGRCRQNVYNLSAMTDPEVRALLDGGRVCVRFYQRDDGTVVTRKCSRMLEAARRRMVALGVGLAAATGGFWGSVAWLRGLVHRPATMGEPLMGLAPRALPPGPPPPMPRMGEPLMGAPPPPDPPKPPRPPKRRALMGKPRSDRGPGSERE
jgi:hypothetical protein